MIQNYIAIKGAKGVFNTAYNCNFLSLITPITDKVSRCEIYFQTKSGNIYKIYRSSDLKKNPGWILISAKSPKLRHELTSGEIAYGRLSIGEPFYFGYGCVTTEITKIQVVLTDVSAPPQTPKAIGNHSAVESFSATRNAATKSPAPKQAVQAKATAGPTKKI